MKHHWRCILLLSVVGCCVPLSRASCDDLDSTAGSLSANAAVARPVLMLIGVEAGRTKMLDTYLTPIYYSGPHFALSFEHRQATAFRPATWERKLHLRADYSKTGNPAGNHTTHVLTASGSWGLYYHRPVFAPRLEVLAGGETEFSGGVLYNPSLSNNVTSARIRFSVGVTAGAQYSLRALGVPLTLRYQASLPVLGAFFSPDYDETYYEIYLGNRSGLVHAGWWGTRFDLDQRVTADWQLRGTTLRIGYANHIERSHVSGIYTRLVSHSVVLAVGGLFSTQQAHKQ